MPVVPATRSRASRNPVALRLALVVAFPFLAALTVVGMYLGKEVILAALWVAFFVLGLLAVNPVIGIVLMTGMFLLAAYPTLLQSLGVLTLNNLLGVGLAALLVKRVLETRDLSFLRNKQVIILALIGLCFYASSYYSEWAFPLLQMSRGKKFILDRSAEMGHDFFARLVFLMFFLAFVRTRRDAGALFLTFMMVLYLAVPSALINWAQGTLLRGFRASASLTAGANPNRLAMICLMEIACLWFWSLSRPGRFRRVVATVGIGAAMVVLLTTGSRSGLLGCFVLVLILQTGAKGYRVPTHHISVAVATGVFLVATIIPAAYTSRMLALNPAQGEAGASSNKMREDTIWTATRMVREHPVFGIGLGKFREVSRQVYGDKYYRPPHNSVLWAASEGGLLVLGLYFLLFWVTWRDLQVVTRFAPYDPTVGHIAAAIRAVFLLYFFFAFFADLFLNPITYILIGLVATMRRYVETLPEVQVVPAARRPRLVARAA
jgi:hypothetical protein